jgi:hypothetical protein
MGVSMIGEYKRYIGRGRGQTKRKKIGEEDEFMKKESGRNYKETKKVSCWIWDG